MVEFFKDLELEGFEGCYEIGCLGTLMSKERLSQSTSKGGKVYFRKLKRRPIILNCGKKSPLLHAVLVNITYLEDGSKKTVVKTLYIHKAVAEAFIEKPKEEDKNKVAHIDPYQPQNNKFDNLMWADQSFFSTRNMILYPENINKLRDKNIKSGYYKKLAGRYKRAKKNGK